MRVDHGAGLPYVFDTHDDWLPTAEADRALTGVMHESWARFARTGNPNPVTSDLDWPEFGATGALLVWDQPISTGAPMDEELCPLLGWETTP